MPEGDSGSTEVELDVSLSHVADQPVTVGLAGFGTTISSDDLEFLPSTAVTFMPGELHKTLTLRVHGDVEFEGDEDYWILPNTRLIRDANVVDGRITILDDDAASLSIDDVTVTEGDSGAATARFTVTRSHVGGAVEFDFATEDGSATAGDDYVARSDRVAFDAGSPVATVSVPVRDDPRDEPDETFRVRLSNPSNATIGDGVAVGTIEDDDPEPSLSIDDASVTEGDTGAATANFRVRLSTPSEKSVTVDFATADGTANAPDDYSAETGQLTIPRGSPTAQIAIPIAGDRLDEPDETFSVQLLERRERHDRGRHRRGHDRGRRRRAVALDRRRLGARGRCGDDDGALHRPSVGGEQQDREGRLRDRGRHSKRARRLHRVRMRRV